MIAQRTSPLIEYKHSSAIKQAVTSDDSDENRLVLTLHFNGMITECNRAGSRLLGCLPSELIWQHVSRLLPQLKNVALMEGSNLNPYLHFLSRVGYKFDVISHRGARLVARVFFCEIGSMEHRFLRVIICPLSQERMAS
jgi:light-regulated signal transduction histidine kinase (bacteriophytochrome)